MQAADRPLALLSGIWSEGEGPHSPTELATVLAAVQTKATAMPVAAKGTTMHKETARSPSWITGSQYTQLIARKIREEGVYCRILPHTTTAAPNHGARDQAIRPLRRTRSVYDPRRRCLMPTSPAWAPVLGI
jgi:hypothetical protein